MTISVIAFLSALLGSMVGLGGGILLAPILLTAYSFPTEKAVSLTAWCVLASATTAATRNFKHGKVDLTLASRLIPLSVCGGIIGYFLRDRMGDSSKHILFALVLIISATSLISLQIRKGDRDQIESVRDWKKNPAFRYQNFWLGSLIFSAAGILASTLGVGGGVLKIPALDKVMKVPFKISTATSGFIVPFTVLIPAIAGLTRHTVLITELIGPMIGAVGGAMLGAEILHKAPTRALRWVLIVIVLGMAAKLTWNI